MRRTALVLVVLIPSAAVAQPWPGTAAMTCAKAQAQVRALGATSLYTNPASFERFVSDRRSCPNQHRAEEAVVATKDTNECRIGLRCVANPAQP